MTETIRYRRGRKSKTGSSRIIRGLLVSILVTLVSVAVFALIMQWVKPSDEAIRIFNQALKLVAIAAGVWTAVGRGSVGLAYMTVGVAAYALLSGQHAPLSSYLADLGMGIASGGIVGMILSNFFAK